MEFDAVLIPSRRATSVARGWWHERTVNDELDASVAACPDRIALSATRVDDRATTRFTYREMATMADRIAVGLSRLGVARNDVVSLQLPNWWQFTLTYLACARIGAVLNPLMHIFRERELSFMLSHSRSKVMIVPKLFRGFDFEHMMIGLTSSLPDLRHVVVVGGEMDGKPGPNSFEALLSGPPWELEVDAREILTRDRPGPDDVTQLLYTSGTTGQPKGVMHTSNTLLANIVPYAEAMRLNRGIAVPPSVDRGGRDRRLSGPASGRAGLCGRGFATGRATRFAGHRRVSEVAQGGRAVRPGTSGGARRAARDASGQSAEVQAARGVARERRVQSARGLRCNAWLAAWGGQASLIGDW
jgi:acyl-CoA synthetase (AMP-forming)/AMP-acid ligase II